MLVEPPFELTLVQHAQGLFVCDILFSSFGEEEDFQRFCIKLTMSKMFFAIISPII